ncbi:MAG: SDR family oxidoreductase [Bacteroidia bacterium]
MKALITGATKGIGREITFALAKKGYDLVLIARNENDLEELKYALNSQEPTRKVIIVSCDLSKKEEIKAMEILVKKEWKTLDVLINNAGIYKTGTATDEPDGNLESCIASNLYSAYHVTRAFADEMKKAGKGHIFNMCSVLSKHPRVDASAYTISKFALLGFNRVLCEDMRCFGVKVTAVLPGSTNTASWDGFNAPADEFVQPKDVANAIVNALEMSPSALAEEIIIKPLHPGI